MRPMAAVPEPFDLALPPRHDVPNEGRSGFVIVEGRQVHYLEWGALGAPPVVCLHGGAQTAYMYEALGAALRGRYHVLAPDLPGHGDSDPIPEMRRQALAVTIPPLLAEFGLDRVALVGASLGGITSLTLAAARPELVASIALIDIGTQLEDVGVNKIIDFMGAHESFGSLEEAASAIGEYLPGRKAGSPERLRRNLRQRDDGRWEWKHGFGRRMRAADGEGTDGTGRGLGAGDGSAGGWRSLVAGLDDEVRGIAVPVLVLRGQRSDVLSDEGAEAIAAALPDGRLATIGGAGHLAAGDNPATTTELISGFLTDIGW